MDDVAVIIPAVWVRRINSPWMYVVGALTGVSVSFAPLFLFQLGRSQAEYWNPLVLLCFAIIYLVPGFYMRLAGIVLSQLYKMSQEAKQV